MQHGALENNDHGNDASAIGLQVEPVLRKHRNGADGAGVALDIGGAGSSPHK